MTQYEDDYFLQESDKLIEIFPKLRLQILKEIYEGLGISLGNTDNLIAYKNYLINNPEMFGQSGGYGGVNSGGAPMLTSGQIKANALKVISILMQKLGLTKEQACGICGPLTSESQMNPAIFNKGEKNGTYTSSGANNTGAPYGDKHCPWSYGAGICQWTFTQRKESAIMGGLRVSREKAISIIKGGGIESLSLENQVDMLIYELQTTYKNVLAGIKKCKTAAQAAATFYCHGLAGFSKSSEPATQAEIDHHNERYSHIGANSQINKGMRYAEGYMKE